MISCAACGESMPDGTRFCDQCGTPLQDVASARLAAALAKYTTTAVQDQPRPPAESEEAPAPAFRQHDRFIPFASRLAIRQRL